jgi:methyl farnesoate epoxidase/farnesoate epoxidase
MNILVQCPYSQENIDEHLSTRLQADVARDFIDVYMDEMEEQLKANVSTTFSSNIY